MYYDSHKHTGFAAQWFTYLSEAAKESEVSHIYRKLLVKYVV